MQVLYIVITSDPSIDLMDHPKFVVSNLKEESITSYRVKEARWSIRLGDAESRV